MDAVTLPTSGPTYVDANVVIYTVEKHPRYSQVLRPLWVAADAGAATVFTSELVLVETLVGPYKNADLQLAADYEAFLNLPAVQLTPVSKSVLREAARLRAAVAPLRTPDAIHAATARLRGVASFVTNDVAFRSVPGLNVVILDDVAPGP
jgi:predicted nucleic acid-binding protein